MEMNSHEEAVRFVALLKACTTRKDLSKGICVHIDIQRKCLLEKNAYVASTLISMYAKCGALVKAHEVLEELPIRNVVTWNALISGYSQNSRCDEALHCFECMQNEGLTPNTITLISVLKACGSMGAINIGQKIHDDMMGNGLLKKDIMLGTALIDMYAKCGKLETARQVLEELPARNVVSWSAIIAEYAQQGQGQEAINCFERMQSEGISPNEVTFIFVLSACGSIGAINKGKQIHDEILRRGFLEKSLALGNALIDMYAKCGMVAKAQGVLECLRIRGVVSWSSLIAGYAQQQQGYQAIECFERMQNENFSPDAITYVCILKACGSSQAIDKGREVHNKILSTGLLDECLVLGTALMDMYVKCGVVAKAEQVLQELPVRDVITWNALIAGYAQHEQFHEAVSCYECMKNEGISPNGITFICILKACSSVGAVRKGKQIHNNIVSRSLMKKDIVLGNALVNMYAKCGALAKAQHVLNEIPIRYATSWNALIAAYTQKDQGLEAINCFRRMQSDGVFPDAITFVCVLKACGSTGTVDMGDHIYEEIVSRGLLEKNLMVGNALVDMYVKCGMLMKAQKILNKLPIRDVISWNGLIAGYAKQGQCHEALDCFVRMQNEGLSPDVVTFIYILKACGNTGAIDKGKYIHDEILKTDFLEKDIMLGTALVDMYTKCSVLGKAKEVLRELPHRDVVTWNTLLAGYTQQGQGVGALKCFEDMLSESVSPDDVTFMCVLSACGHSGLLDDAQVLFEDMTRKYEISPNYEHHICMIRAFGRAGYFDKAMSLIKVMPCSDDPSVWLALLGACRKWVNVKLGKLAFDEVVKLDNTCAGAYVLMADIFIAVGMQEDAQRIEIMRLKYAVCEN